MEVVAEAEGELTVGPVDEAFVVFEDEIYIFQGIAGLGADAHRAVTIVLPAYVAPIVHTQMHPAEAKAGEKPVHRRIILRMRTRLPAKET